MMALDHRVLRVVELCRAAALRGEACPKNGVLAAAVGARSGSTVVDLLYKATLAGLIRVYRGQCSRIVEAADGSWRTAGVITAPHWRDRPGASPQAKPGQVKARPKPSQQTAPTARTEAAPPARPLPAPAPAPAAPVALSVELVTARLMARVGGARPARGCRYPMWPNTERPPQPPLFCSEPVQPGSSYCPAHHALCRVSPRDWATINAMGPTRGWGSVPR
jgi:hypothetical protein